MSKRANVYGFPKGTNTPASATVDEVRQSWYNAPIMQPDYCEVRLGLSTEDLEQFLRLAHGFLKKPMHVGIEDEDQFVEATRETGAQLLVDPNTHFCIAYADSQMIGYAYCNIHPALHLNGRECMVRELYVRPEYRRRKVGTAIIERIKELAREHGCPRIALATNWQSEEQRSFYETVNVGPRCDFTIAKL